MAWGHAISAEVRHQTVAQHMQSNRTQDERNRSKAPGSTSYRAASSPARAASVPLLSPQPHVQVFNHAQPGARLSVEQFIAAVFRPVSETLRTMRQRLSLNQLTKNKDTASTDSDAPGKLSSWLA